MKTLLYILDYYLPHRGGVETVFEQIINRSLSKGYKVIILTSHFDKTLKKEEKIGNVTIIRTGANRKSFIWYGFWKGITILKKNHIDGIHTSTYGGAIPASLLGKFFHKKVLLTVHEIFGKLRTRYKPRYSRWMYYLFEKTIFSLPFSAYHCVSYYTLNCLRIYYGIKDEKLFIAHNGVDYQFWNKNKIDENDIIRVQKKFNLQKKRTLLYFGHTGISKGIDLLVDNINPILSLSSDIQLIFNFTPSQRDHFIKQRIKQIIEKLPPTKKNRIQIRSGLEKKELRALVASVNGVIAPSLSEGFGSVHTETIALGMPLITTYIASLPEVLGGPAIFFQPENGDALCNAIKKLKKGELSPLPEKRFSRDDQFIKIEERYKKL